MEKTCHKSARHTGKEYGREIAPYEFDELDELSDEDHVVKKMRTAD